ncbi:threonine--tRNA ligase [Silvibacterium dinghuense]|uniref:Threonine--tRNA ligase n=1 Tax=Silvibacterium dinghuense TaxID=1560006 RepID=A0A4Q1SJZ3_9BACT|nr:threonine--tRNA ligase [Silvibacterium dinghuense]RXS97767.1 threonine--tRNA ligase [Silvibacterium dinghuense]GGH01853.1 threonine--tRNA ligase [Silvibacterium dinghuense]
MSALQDQIQVHLPDGSVKDFAAGVTPFQVAESISPRLAAASVVARIQPLDSNTTETGPKETPGAAATSDDAAMYAAEDANAPRLVDLATPLTTSVKLQLLTEKDPDALKVVRHSAAHVLATAVLELFPETKLGHGPATDSGFFYDFYRPTPFTPEDLEKIEKKMAEVVARDEKFTREYEPREKGLHRFKADNDFMKIHFIERFTKEGDDISLYRNGAFVDFCRGPHVPSTGRVKAFKVTNLAGAYWLGDEKNPQLQRVYGTAFFSKKEMDEHFARLEEAARRDHRALGKQLDLFSIQDLAGPGLIFWHPKGAMIRKIMEDWMREECIRRGYDLVYTPHTMRVNLWQTSGHEGFYSANFFTKMELDDADYRLKPMNCPGHILIYKNSPKSYRDLPVRYAELGNVYRYERSGTMHGLLRVRGFTQDDAHIFCRRDQVESEIAACIDFAQSVLETFGFKEFKVELSSWDPKDRQSYAGSDADWELAIGSLERVLQEKGIPYKEIPGEAAFYGPKIDMKLVDAIGRLWQLSTVQFDFNLPARFELEYVGEDGERHQPVMVHRALFGSVERFFGVLIEHYAGAFPLWLAPIQIGLVPISERHLPYAQQVEAELKKAGFRVELDARNEKMNAKIRDLTMQKVPYVLVMGDKEAEANAVSVRARGKGDQGSQPLADFIAHAAKLAAEKSLEL